MFIRSEKRRPTQDKAFLIWDNLLHQRANTKNRARVHRKLRRATRQAQRRANHG